MAASPPVSCTAASVARRRSLDDSSSASATVRVIERSSSASGRKSDSSAASKAAAGTEMAREASTGKTRGAEDDGERPKENTIDSRSVSEDGSSSAPIGVV